MKISKIIKLLLYSFLFTCSVNAQDRSFNRVLELFQQLESSVEQDYNGNEKWLAFVEGEIPAIEVKGGIFFDMADYLQITDEGKEGWVTVYLNSGFGIGLSTPVSFGFTKRTFNPTRPDRQEDFLICDAGLEVPVIIPSWDFENNVEIELEPFIGASIGAGCGFEVLSYEVRRGFLDQILTDALINSENPADFAFNLLNELESNVSEQLLFPLTYLLNKRFTTSEDNVSQFQMKFINYDDLDIGESGTIKVGFISSQEDEYRVKVLERNRILPPDWDFIDNKSEFEFLSANQNHVVVFNVTPSSFDEVFSYTIERNGFIGNPNEIVVFDQISTGSRLGGNLTVQDYSYKNGEIHIVFNRSLFDYNIQNGVQIFDENNNSYNYSYEINFNELIIYGVDLETAYIIINGIYSEFGSDIESEISLEIDQIQELSVDFNSDSQYVILDNAINFSAQVNRNEDEIIEYQWDFNADGIIDAITENPSFIYDETGVFDVTLAITDVYGETKSKTRINHITVAEEPTEQTITIFMPTRPYQIGDEKSVIAQIDPPIEGVGVTFFSSDENVAEISSSTSITNSNGYAGSSIIFHNSGSAFISATADGYGQNNGIAEVIDPGQPTFIAAYRSGDATYSEYQITVRFEEDFVDEVLFETDNGFWEKGGSQSRLISTNDYEVSADLIVNNTNETRFQVTALGNTYIYYFTPILFDNSTAIPSFRRIDGVSDINAIDWTKNGKYLFFNADDDLVKVNSMTWEEEIRVDLGRKIRGFQIANTKEEIAVSYNDEIKIVDFNLDQIREFDFSTELPTTEHFVNWTYNDAAIAIADYKNFHTIRSASTLSRITDIPISYRLDGASMNPSKSHYAISVAEEDSPDDEIGIQIYSTSTWNKIDQIDLTINDDDENEIVDYSYDGKYLAVVNQDDNVTQIFETTNYDQVFNPLVGSDYFASWHPSEYILAVVNESNILIYEATSASILRILAMPSGYQGDDLQQVEWSNDGAILSIVTENDDYIYLYSPFDVVAPSFDFNVPTSSSKSSQSLSFVGYDESGVISIQVDLNGNQIISQTLESGEETTFDIDNLIDGANTITITIKDRFSNVVVEEYELVKEDQYLISGGFTTYENLLLNEISIILKDAENIEFLQSDENGFFEFEIGASDSIAVTFEKEGFKFEPNEIVLENITEPKELSVFVTELMYQLSVTVLDTSDIVIKDVELFLISGDSTKVSSTDDQGRAIFRLSPGMDYEIHPEYEFYSFSPNTFSIENAHKDYTLTFTGTLELNSETDLSISLLDNIVLNESFTLSIEGGLLNKLEEVTYIEFDLIHKNANYKNNSEILGEISNESTSLSLHEKIGDTLTVRIDSEVPLTGFGNLINLSFFADSPGELDFEIVNAIGSNSVGEMIKFSVTGYRSQLTNNVPVVISELRPLDNLQEDFESVLVADLDTLFIDRETKKLNYELEYSGSLFNPLISGDSLIIYSVQDRFGKDSLIIKAFDSFSDSVSQQLDITIRNVNDAPILSFDTKTVEFSAKDSAFVKYSVRDVDNLSEEITISVLENSPAFRFTDLRTNDSLIIFRSFDESDSLNEGKLYIIAKDISDGFTLDSVTVLINRLVSNDIDDLIPIDFTLDQNYPNPFNPTTNIRFGLPKSSDVRIEIFNLLGQKVLTLLSENLRAGYHVKKIDMSQMASGIYIYRLQASDFVEVKKMMLIK